MRRQGRCSRSPTGCGWCAGTAGTWPQSTRRRRDDGMRRLVTLVTGVAIAALWCAGPAMAAGDGERVGENLGKMLGGWAQSLYVGIAGLVALMFLLNRRFADLAVFMIAVVVVRGFVMAPNDIASTVRDIWHTLTA